VARRRRTFEKVVATDSLSSVLTVAAALVKLGLAGRPKLTIWLIGADHEADQPWLELLCWLPEVRELTLKLAGPHAPEHLSAALAVQPLLTAGTGEPPVLRLSSRNGLYHECEAGLANPRGERAPYLSATPPPLG
jgi:hypothetical protein